MERTVCENEPILHFLQGDAAKQTIARKAVEEAWTIEQIESADEYSDARRNATHDQAIQVPIPIRGSKAKYVRYHVRIRYK